MTQIGSGSALSAGSYYFYSKKSKKKKKKKDSDTSCDWDCCDFDYCDLKKMAERAIFSMLRDVPPNQVNFFH